MKSENLEAILRGLLDYEQRPDNISTTDILTMIALLMRGGLRKPVTVSHDTLGMDIDAAPSTVKRALEELRDPSVRWLEKISGKGRANANRYMILLENLPIGEDIKRTIVTEATMKLAHMYAHNIMKPYTRTTRNGKKKTRRFTLGNYQRFAFTLQRLQDRYCGGDQKLLCDVINFAVDDPRYREKARRGPHGLRRDFTMMLAEVRKKQEPVPAQAPGAQQAA
ncbi:MAG TPA: hypothetical protein VHA06_22360 [Candidatus Angelobacter sp.]|jgi:hypothetical protein|nr:hypothetical protein [Candidatus Angelobacter sp.]